LDLNFEGGKLQRVVAMPNLIHSIESRLDFAATGLVVAVTVVVAVTGLVVIAAVSAVEVELEVQLV
jgi:hypothetical protein